MATVWDAWVRFVTSGHESIFRMSGGRTQGTVLGMRAVRMTSVGARSGALRTVMLIAPVIDRDRIVVVGSNMGSDESPAWYHNVVAHPFVEVDTGGSSRAMRARVVTGGERVQVWAEVVRAAPIYELYQARTPRQLPILVLEPC